MTVLLMISRYERHRQREKWVMFARCFNYYLRFDLQYSDEVNFFMHTLVIHINARLFSELMHVNLVEKRRRKNIF